MQRSGELKIAPELPLGAVDREFSLAAWRQADAEPRPAVLTWILDDLAPIARTCNAAITTKILAMVDSPEYRLEGARKVLADVGARLDRTAAMFSSLIGEIGKDLERVRRRVTSACGSEGDSPVFRRFTPQEAALYQEYCRIRLCESVHRCLLDRVRDVQTTVEHLAAKLTALDLRFQELAVLLGHAGAGPSADGRAEASPAGSAESEGGASELPSGEDGSAPLSDAASSVAFLASAFEERVRTNPRLRPSSLFGGGGEAAQRMLASLGDEAARFLQIHLAASDAPDDAAAAGPACEADAMPRLMNLGGGCRLLGVARDAASLTICKRKLEATFGDCVTIQRDPGVDPFTCCEVEGIDIESIISQVARGDARLTEMASRVHTRTDIQW